ncbi:hypothetical protein L9G16_09075 [Shewanella sp. A25]|nr:hypothetical protein [Shewanella shenzhenensis]
MRPLCKQTVSLALTMMLLGCNAPTEAKTTDTTPAPASAPTPSEPATLHPVTTQPVSPQPATGVNTRVQPPANGGYMRPSITPAGEGVMLQGTVRYIGLEGGFWGIITDNGKQILPKNLPQDYKKDGLRLSFTAQEITGMMTIQQWGTLSSLSDITVIGQVDSKANNPEI